MSTKVSANGLASWIWPIFLIVASGVGGALLTSMIPSPLAWLGGGHEEADLAHDPVESDEPVEDVSNIIDFPEDRWPSAGIETVAVVSGPFERLIELTGKIALNQDRVAHIYPMVEGMVDSVEVRLGQQVNEGDLLLVVHSREVGQAKLDLYKSRLMLQMAKVKEQLTHEISENTKSLVDALRQKRGMEEIENEFRSRPMGDYRERLVAAYASYLKSEADALRLEGLVESGAVSAKQMLAAEANRIADLATFQARIEQIEYEMGTSVLLSSQAVKELETQVAVSETNLRILGSEEEELQDIDPAKQGQSISHYPVRAPFDGSVLSKDVVLSEQVRPDVLMLSIADLSTVWVTADIYEEHVPILKALENSTLTIRNEAWPDRQFSATVFYAGEVMEELSRTISMRAIADNQDRLLKPGMFVTVELPEMTHEPVLQIPRAAVQEHDGRSFVFVYMDEGKFQRRDITVGDLNETSVVVTRGLQSGEVVASKGGFVLKSLLLSELMGEE
ncbi:MAG: efflux RND transporter periplasmic adaptor subunit [Planctomycetales bacterium]|nr:efflux RND transporter periplasmic adaptor subunit [Planctomycetales bacterium]